MPPKKDVGNGDVTKLLAGFEDKEVKLLAAAFVSSIGTDKVSISILALHATRHRARVRTQVPSCIISSLLQLQEHGH
jgi:hypothetical protein